MYLSPEDIQHLHTGALFNACAGSHVWCQEEVARILDYMVAYDEAPRLLTVDELGDDDLVVAVGYVYSGHSVAELRPVGDEFLRCIRLIEEALERRVGGIIPLAAGNVNAVSPLIVSMQAGLPLIDADPMGRIFPLVDQTVFTLNGRSVGPVAAVGALGESALLAVDRPRRGERLLRAAADEFGGWAATASYPMEAATLARIGVLGSLSRLIRIGRVLDLPLSTSEKYDALRRIVEIKHIIRGRVESAVWPARPALPGQMDWPAGVVLSEVPDGRLVQLEIKNELLMVMVDGSVRAAVPDIITMLRPEDGGVAALEDLWAGNTVDIVSMKAADPWYSAEGLALGGPAAFNLIGQKAGGGALS